jgi:hypothetical protein
MTRKEFFKSIGYLSLIPVLGLSNEKPEDVKEIRWPNGCPEGHTVMYANHNGVEYALGGSHKRVKDMPHRLAQCMQRTFNRMDERKG